MNTATVNIPLSELDQLRDSLRVLQNRVVELEKQVVEAKMSDPAGTIRLLQEIVDHALPVVQFAIANLEPSTVRGWPHESLREFAKKLVEMPNATTHTQELSREFEHFAKLAAGYEEFRRERDAKRVVLPATVEDYGPKTEEAAMVHAQLGVGLGARIRAAETDST